MKKLLRVFFALMLMMTVAPLYAQVSGEGTEAAPYAYTWFDDLTINGPKQALNPSDWTFHEVTCRAEGVMEITNNTTADQIVLLKNGKQIINSIAKGGATTSILVKMNDVITFKMVSQADQSNKTIQLHWRAIQYGVGEEWNDGVAMVEGENEIPQIRNNQDLAKWYTITVPAGKKATLKSGYISAKVFTVDNAASETNGQALENVEGGCMYTYSNTKSSPVVIYVKVSAANSATTATLSFDNGEVEEGNGSEETPVILSWDTESFRGPAAGIQKTYYQLTSNYEGVLIIKSNLKGSVLSDLTLNGARIGNVVSREVLVKRGDVIVFAVACEEDNTQNTIELSYRAAKAGEEWNNPIALAEGENEMTAVENNIDLAKWYKVSVPAGMKATIELPYGVAMVYTADNAMSEARGDVFENTEKGMTYTYNNDDARIVDLYVKVSSMNTAGTATVTFAEGEINKGNGSEAAPYILAWDTESFFGPAAEQKTYYQLTSNYEGVLTIKSNLKGEQINEIYVNGVRQGSAISRDLLINRKDVVLFVLNTREDNSANTIELSYRSVAEGEIWNMPIALAEGENEIAAVENNVDLAKWYKVSVPAGTKATIELPYGVAMVYTADNAMSEARGDVFENTEKGMTYTYNNDDARIVDLYVKVSSMNEAGTATVTFAEGEINKGNGSEAAPYILAWDTESFFGPAAEQKTYYQLTSNYEGVLTIKSNLEGEQINEIYVNGVRQGSAISRDLLIFRKDVVLFVLNTREDNSANTIELSYRSVAEGEIWNMPIALAEGENEIAAVENNVDLAKWYKFSVPGGKKATLTMGYGVAEAFTADNAMSQMRGAGFENTEKGMTYTYTNDEVRTVDIYVKVASMNEACTAELSFEDTEITKGNGTEYAPYILAWDTEEFNAPAAGANKTYYQLTSNYEGVMVIDASVLQGNVDSELTINGVNMGEVTSREVLIYRKDIVTFAIACEEDNAANPIKLSYRSVEDGEIWNQPITLVQGENTVGIVEKNVDLAKWYKISIPANAKMKLYMPFGHARVFTADNAAAQTNGIRFENSHVSMEYVYNNTQNTFVDIYVKVCSQPEVGTAVVEFSAAEQNVGNGTENDPFILAWDVEEFNAPAAGTTKTYYQFESNNEGVMIIDASAIQGQTMTDLFINGTRVGNLVSREVLVNRHDIVTFAIACEQDNSQNTIKIGYRAAKEGEIWNMPLALVNGDNTIEEVKLNIDLSQWYKVTVAAGEKLEIQFNGYAAAEALTAEQAAAGAAGTQFEGNDKGVFYSYDNAEGTSPVDIYVKVSANNSKCTATIKGAADADAISSIFAAGADKKAFDLNGRAVKNMQKGKVYIVNGVKVLVK